MNDKLAKAIQEVNKRFGKGSMVALDDSSAADPIESFSTGNKLIDGITGIGGVPRGRVTEIYGPEAGGKTTLTLQIIRSAQLAMEQAVFVDAEHTLDVKYAQQLGVDTKNLLISQPDCGEDALSIVETMIASESVGLIVVDSVAALVPRHELEGDMGDAQMGLQARLMGQALRKLTPIVARTGTSLIFINQIREKLNVTFGSPETTTGGRALKFYASLRLDVRRTQQIKKGENIIGAKTKIKTAKNKMYPPLKDVEVPLIYGQGFVNEEEE